MKSEAGITLNSLIVYIVGITIIMSIVILITNFFRQNILEMEDSSANAAEFSKFNLAFVEEVKTYKNEITEISEHSISFSSGNTYLFQDNKIYKNKIAIANDVANCSFSVGTYETKQVITVYIEIGGLAKTTEYVLSYEEDAMQL